MFDGQDNVGFWASLTVTVKEQLAEFFEESVAVQVTVVTPFWNVVPDAGEQLTIAPVQLSEAVGVV